MALRRSDFEVDNCFEVAATIAGKFDKYMRLYRREVKDTDGKEKAMWRTRWHAPADQRWLAPADGYPILHDTEG
jgi:hypothetical protein